MKNLIWFWGRKGGGAKYSEEIAKEFVNQDYSNTYLSFSKDAENFYDVNSLTDKSFHVNTYNNKLSFLIKSILLPILIVRFIVFIKKNKINNVITTMPHLWTIFFIPFFNLLKIKHIVTIHDATPHPGDFFLWKIINSYLCKLSYKIIVLSKYVKKEVISRHKISDSKIICSIHGLLSYSGLTINCKSFNDISTLRLVFFGRIEKYKGLKYLLKAQIELEKSYKNIKLEIYGSGDLSIYKKYIKNIKNIKIENRWIEDDEIYKIFSRPCINTSAYIEASQSGTIPIALSCGIPTIGTNVGALSEQICHDKTGFIINRDNIVDEIIEKVEYCLLNKNRLTEMSSACIDYTDKHLSWINICKELKDHLKNA